MIRLSNRTYEGLRSLAARDPNNKLRRYVGRIECITCGGILVPWNNNGYHSPQTSTNGHDGHLFVYLDEDKWV